MSFLGLYDTYKTVRIADRRLGYSYYGLVLIIFIYTIMYTVIYTKGYFEFETPVGAVSFHVSQKQREISTQDISYCQNEQCRIWDAAETIRTGKTHAIYIVTNVRDSIERRVCPLNSPSCTRIWEKESSERYNIADIESMEVHIHHSMQAPLFYEDSNHSPAYAEGNKHMEGVMLAGFGSSKRILKRFPHEDCDRISVRELLEAASLDLSNTTDAPGREAQSFRDTGMIFHVDLAYNNIRCDGKLGCAFGTTPITYRYRVYRVPETEYTETEMIALNETHRIRRELHGIYINIVQTGKIGRFSFQVLIVHLCSGLGMMALGTVIVDFVAIYLLPNRGFYSAKKYSFVSSEEVKKAGAAKKQRQIEALAEKRKAEETMAAKSREEREKDERALRADVSIKKPLEQMAGKEEGLHQRKKGKTTKPAEPAQPRKKAAEVDVGKYE